MFRVLRSVRCHFDRMTIPANVAFETRSMVLPVITDAVWVTVFALRFQRTGAQLTEGLTCVLGMGFRTFVPISTVSSVFKLAFLDWSRAGRRSHTLLVSNLFGLVLHQSQP